MVIRHVGELFLRGWQETVPPAYRLTNGPVENRLATGAISWTAGSRYCKEDYRGVGFGGVLFWASPSY
jgi:hypothetical protein